jgi:hypothetical protein
MAKEPIYWHGDLGRTDDFGVPYENIMYDGRTKRGPWANMTITSWRIHGCGFLGVGNGQKYKKQADGRWLKIEG